MTDSSYIDSLMRPFYDTHEYLSTKVRNVSKGLQEQIGETITELVEVVIRPMLLKMMTSTYELHDGTKLTPQEAFDRAVMEDKDVYAMMIHYKPSNLKHIHRARRFRQYIIWDSNRLSSSLADFLRRTVSTSRPRERDGS